MVVKLMRWRPWPPIFSKKFKVNLRVHSLDGLEMGRNGEENGPNSNHNLMMIKVKWKGSKGGLGYRFRGSQKRARTTEKVVEEGCIINWQEDFEHVCVLTVAKDTGFLPFDVHFVIIQVGTKSKTTVLGSATMNLGDFAPSTQEIIKHTTRLCILPSKGVQKQAATLVVTVNFSEVPSHESLSLERFMTPSLPCLSGPLLCDQQIREVYEKKVKDMKRSVSLNWKKTSGELESIMCNGKLSPRSEESSSDTGELFDTDSLDDSEEDKVADGEEQLLQSYGPLVGVNLVVEGALPNFIENRHIEENSSSLCSIASSEASANETSTSESDQSTTMRSLLSWKKRKLSFRSPRAQGEPLLNKAYGEDGGDDIDHDRRLSSYPMEPFLALCQKDENSTVSSSISKCLDFGEEHFSVGCWEKKDLVSRDGHMKLSTSVFFASIDQRSERAAGESACTALVAVIADWLHNNPDRMPIKAEFDTLIREGSAEWRKLCDLEVYRDRFPDKHFDLDTVLKAKIRPLMVSQEWSFIGFFKLEGVGDTCNFLQGAMSFDNIWQAIEEASPLKPDGSFEPAVYIVSWNDHFFVLKVDKEAYYIIDTLGERLYEGCNQAYILRFDTETILSHVPKLDKVDEKKGEKKSSSKNLPASSTETAIIVSTSSIPSPLPQQPDETVSSTQQEHETAKANIDPQKVGNNILEYKAKDACKHFVKGFFAALPLRELQTDIKKGLLGKIPLHQRLQIEFHFTSLGHMSSPSKRE